MAKPFPNRLESVYDLPTHQRRLRHLKCVAVRNLVCKSYKGKDVAKLQTYFTLHKDSRSKAFYTSEKISGSLNPTWQSFDIRRFESDLNTSSRLVVVRVWVGHDNKFNQLLDWEVSFSGLLYQGSKLQKEGVKYAANSVVLGMFDRYFTAPADDPAAQTQPDFDITKAVLKVEQVTVRTSYNTSSLSRIHTVLRAIKQTQASVRRVHHSIEDRLLSSQEMTQKICEQERLVLRVQQLRGELQWQTSRLQTDKDLLDKGQQKSKERGQLLKSSFTKQTGDDDVLTENRRTCIQSREMVVKENAQLWMRRKQLVSELAAYIYQVTEGSNNHYYICNVKLPNSEDFQGKDDTMIAVALGNTSHMVIMISQILDLPLRFPMEHRGSRSHILDHIHTKLLDKDREFPLYTKGKEKFQFNYGVFLLNKNISQVRFYCGLGTTDLRQTLSNLCSLMELRLGVKYTTNMALTGTHRPIGNGGSAASHSKEKLQTQKSMGPVTYGRTQNDAFETALINDRKARASSLQQPSQVIPESSTYETNEIDVHRQLEHQEIQESNVDGHLFKATTDEFFQVTHPEFIENNDSKDGRSDDSNSQISISSIELSDDQSESNDPDTLNVDGGLFSGYADQNVAYNDTERTHDDGNCLDNDIPGQSANGDGNPKQDVKSKMKVSEGTFKTAAFNQTTNCDNKVDNIQIEEEIS